MIDQEKLILERDGETYMVRDLESGQAFPIKGYGSLKGMIEFRDDIDLTRPIAEQVSAFARKENLS